MEKLILTDMDGTLTRGSIVLEHAGYLISKGLITDDGSYQAWTQDKKNETLIVAVAENYRYNITGMKVEDLHVKDFIKEQLADSSKWYSVLDEIIAERNKGTHVIIISGSSDFLVQEIAEQLNFEGKGTEYLTDDNNVLTGEVVGMFGESSKDLYIQTLDLTNTEVTGYGDTGADNGIFKHCSSNTLVAPTSETVEYLLMAQAKINRIINN